LLLLRLWSLCLRTSAAVVMAVDELRASPRRERRGGSIRAPLYTSARCDAIRVRAYLSTDLQHARKMIDALR
jgi:hypothetical protein